MVLVVDMERNYLAKILVVDDLAVNRKFLATLLSISNHTILEASDGLQALLSARENHPQLIITDIMMPNMSGEELVKQLSLIPDLAHIPIIFYTATYRLKDVALLALRTGVKYVLAKPSDPKLIIEMVNKALEQKAETTPATVTSESPVITTDLSTESASIAQLTTLSSQLFTLLELNSDLITASDINKLFILFCKGARRILNAKICVIGIFEKQNDTLMGLVVNEQEINYSEISSNQVLSGIFKKKLPVLINELSLKQKQELQKIHPVQKCFLGLPIMVEDRLYGVAYFIDKNDDSVFSDIDMELVTELVSNLSILYENKKLHSIINILLAAMKAQHE